MEKQVDWGSYGRHRPAYFNDHHVFCSFSALPAQREMSADVRATASQALGSLNITQTTFFLFSGFIVYKLASFTLSRFRLRRALSALPGPPPSGLLAGNLDKYFDPSGIPWQEHLTDQYGTAVKLWGPFGVRLQLHTRRAVYSLRRTSSGAPSLLV